jgi:hypothetical protein
MRLQKPAISGRCHALLQSDDGKDKIPPGECSRSIGRVFLPSTIAATELLAADYRRMSTMESRFIPSFRRLCQYRLRLILAVTMLIAIPAAWFAVRMHAALRQKEEVQAIRKVQGCQVAYDGQDVFELKFFDKIPPLPPVTWTESLLGKDYVHRAGTVGVPAARVHEILPHLKRLPYLRRVVILKREDSTQEQVDAAAAKIEHDLPGVETVLLEFDFNIKDNVEVREPD